MQVLHQTLVVVSCCKWMQRKDPEITNNERIHILTFRAHFKISALLFPSSGNHRMIHKKGGRIRTYGRPDPDLLGWVACFALVASVPKQMRCATQRVTLSPPTPLLLMPLPIAGNPRTGRPWPNKNDYPYDQTRTSLLFEREFHDPDQQLVGSKGIQACPT